MPPYNNLTVSGVYFKLTTTVSNADNVTLQVDQAAVATVGDITDLQIKFLIYKHLLVM